MRIGHGPHSLEEAMPILEPHFTTIQESILGGYEEYRAKAPAEWVAGFDSTVKANIVNKLIVHNAENVLHKTHGVDIEVKGRATWFIFNKSLWLRFKKLNRRSLQPANVATNDQKRIWQQLNISGEPDRITYIDAGYTESKLGISIEGIFVACSIYRKLEWWLRLDNKVSVDPVVQIMAQGRLHKPARRVRLKTGSSKESKLLE